MAVAVFEKLVRAESPLATAGLVADSGNINNLFNILLKFDRDHFFKSW